MRKVLRGYAKNKDGNLILIGTIPVPHSKDKRSPRERQDKRHLVRQGATVFKKEVAGDGSLCRLKSWHEDSSAGALVRSVLPENSRHFGQD